LEGKRVGIALVCILVISSMWNPPTIPTEDENLQGDIPIEQVMELDQVDGPTFRLDDIVGSFVENKGQLGSPDILYYAQGKPLSVGLIKDGVVFSLSGEGVISSFTLCFVGGNDVVPYGRSPNGHVSNFIRGNDPARWVRDTVSFSEVIYEDLYDGVDLRFYFTDSMFKYDFQVEGGHNPSCINLRYEGVEEIELDPETGDLLLHTRAGTVRDSAPVVMQHRGSDLLEMDCSFSLTGGNSFGFDLPHEIDPSMPFVIDPGLEFSTFIGGVGDEDIDNMVVDDQGYIWLAGRTMGAGFPVLANAYDDQFDGAADGVLMKLDKDGSKLLISTFIGGNDEDSLSDIRVLTNDTLLILGYTNSDDFPVTQDAIQPDLNVENDLILMLMDNNASTVIYGTYLGGSASEYTKMMALDTYGNIYISGKTDSNDLATPGAYCETRFDLVTSDAYVMKVNSSLRSIDWCSYLAGSDEEEYSNWEKWTPLHSWCNRFSRLSDDQWSVLRDP